MKKVIYTDGDFSCDANKFWKSIIRFSRYGENWHMFKTAEKSFEAYLRKIGAAKDRGNSCSQYVKLELEELLAKVTHLLYGHLDPKTIVDISVKYEGDYIEFYNAKGEHFTSQTSICMGVRGKSIIKTIPFNRSTNSSTQFLESKILKYFKACEKDLTKTNKEALAYKCLELFDKWYDNAGYINGHDGIYVPHGTDPDYRIAVNAASKKGAHWLDGIPSFKVGKKEISTSEIKKMLK